MSATQPILGSRKIDSKSQLLGSVQSKRAEIDEFLRTAVSRRRFLLNLTIMAGAASASLTAMPALGGKSLADWLTATFGLSAPSWQLLCALAAVFSLAATIATQLLRSHNTEEHIGRAQAARAKIEGLEVGLVSREISNVTAATEFRKCIDDVAFIQPCGVRRRGNSRPFGGDSPAE